MKPTGWTIGVDVGGTFTDFVAVHGTDGTVLHCKEPSVAEAPDRAVATGIARLLSDGAIDPVDLDLVVHGTTLGLNALLQRREACVALVVSRGFGDMLELGRGDLPNSYDYKAPKPRPPVPRHRVFEVAARQRPDGTVLARPTPIELAELAPRLVQSGAAAVAVSVINAYADPALEDEIVAALARLLPGVVVTGAARLWPEIREYERTLVAVLNSLIHPLLDRYYAALEGQLRAIGILAPLYITTSTGGSMTTAAARLRPIDTVLSGPAAGTVAAARLAAEAGVTRVISLDMGGTSSDIAISETGAPEIADQTTIGDYLLMLPVTDVWAIGAGGGSIVWVDDEGVIKVGPRSAGSQPGPICYARGGAEPTLTDCYLAAGFLDAEYFLGGRVRLDLSAAVRALDAIGARLGYAAADRAARVADAALRVATARMASAMVNGFARRGLDPRQFTLLPYGGAGPTQAVALADAVALSDILVPSSPGTFCALGAAIADVRRDFVRARRVRIGIDREAGSAIAAMAAAMEREAHDWIATQGDALGVPEIAVSADLQYPRTAAVLKVALPEAAWRIGDASRIAGLFHGMHADTYGFNDAGSAVDLTALRLAIRSRRPRAPAGPPSRIPAGPPAGRRDVLWRGTWVAADVWRRARLGADQILAGPALVEQDDTTVWIGPGWTAVVDPSGNLRLGRQGTVRR